MTSRIQIFKYNGSFITELDAFTKITWMTNNYGSCTIDLSKNDPKATPEVLAFGNFVHILHEKLPNWIGYIDTPRSWKEGVITIKVFQIESYLDYLVTDKVVSLDGSASVCVKHLMDTVVARRLRIALGSLENSQGNVKKVYNGAKVLSSIKTLCSDVDFLFYMEGYQDADQLLGFKWYFVKNRGLDTLVDIWEGTDFEITSSGFVEQGLISNQITVYGKGTLFTDKPQGESKSEESISKYGIRQLTVVKDTLSSSECTALAVKLVRDLREPRRLFSIRVIDSSDNFKNIRVGNRLFVNFHSVAFGGSRVYAEIQEITYDNSENFADVVIKEKDPEDV